MTEYVIRVNMEISDVERAINSLEHNLDFGGINIEDVVEFINSEKATIFYLDEKMNGISENDTQYAKYAWLDSGFVKGKEPLFISLLNDNGYFSGFYAGTAKYLANNIIKYYPKNKRDIENNLKKFNTKYERKTEDRITKNIMGKYQEHDDTKMSPEDSDNPIMKKIINAAVDSTTLPKESPVIPKPVRAETISRELKQYLSECATKKTIITEEVNHQLMINNWQGDYGLDRYIKVIGTRLKTLINQGREDYYILNNIKSAVVNSGLLNKFGSDIMFMYRYNRKMEAYEAYKTIESKVDMIEEGFTKEQISKKIKPITFFDKDNQVFDAKLDDFDINYSSLDHVIEQRRSRFPESLLEVSSNTIAGKVNSALEIGLKMHHRDRTYVKPIYSSKTETISWVMPLHIFNEFIDDPELVLVVRKVGMFWEIKTILPYDEEMKDKITDLALYHQMW